MDGPKQAVERCVSAEVDGEPRLNLRESRFDAFSESVSKRLLNSSSRLISWPCSTPSTTPDRSFDPNLIERQDSLVVLRHVCRCSPAFVRRVRAARRNPRDTVDRSGQTYQCLPHGTMSVPGLENDCSKSRERSEMSKTESLHVPHIEAI